VGDNENGVVSRNAAEHAVNGTAVERRRHHVGTARWSPHDNEVLRTLDRDNPFTHHAPQVVEWSVTDLRRRRRDNATRPVFVAHLYGA
jgi:hypothetical protein